MIHGTKSIKYRLAYAKDSPNSNYLKNVSTTPKRPSRRKTSAFYQTRARQIRSIWHGIAAVRSTDRAEVYSPFAQAAQMPPLSTALTRLGKAKGETTNKNYKRHTARRRRHSSAEYASFFRRKLAFVRKKAPRIH